MFRRLALPCALLITLALAPAVARADDASASPQTFGAPVTVKKPVVIARLAKNPERFKGRTIRLEGTVKDVCQGKGCWVEVTDGKGASFMARSLDESVLLPKDCKGRHVVVEGRVMPLPRQAAEEPTPADHSCPRPTYVVSTQGVQLTAAAAH